MKPKNLAAPIALCLFALSSSADAGSTESPSAGIVADVLAEMDPLAPSQAPDERVDAAERRLLKLASSSDEAARTLAEAEALFQERWPEIVERTTSMVDSMSDKQREAIYETTVRRRAASDRQEASRQALEALAGDSDGALALGEGDVPICGFLRASEAYFKARCDQQTANREAACLISCAGLAGEAEDECFVNCEKHRKNDLALCAAGEPCITEACCPP